MKEKFQFSFAITLLVAVLAVGFMFYRPNFVQAQQNFPVPTLAAFNPTGQATIAATTTTANVALPTTGVSTPSAKIVILTNESSSATLYVLMGTSNAVTVSATTGYPIAPNGIAVLAIRNNTFIAAIGSATGSLGISTGY